MLITQLFLIWFVGIIPAFIYFYMLANDFAEIKVTPLFMFYVFFWPITIVLVIILYFYIKSKYYNGE